MASPYDEYMNKRSWLIDTAETPADKKNLKAQLAKLDAEYKAKSKTGTQPGHAVTTSKNNTKPVAPAMPTKRPAVGADKSAQKKYGSSSWNNGYTN
jgi:hypothetical protein